MEQKTPNIRIDGHKVRKIREEKGLTQLYVATVIGVTTDTISRWENRRYPTIKRENALKLAQALEVELEEILEMDDEDNSNGVNESTTEHSDNASKPGLPIWKAFIFSILGFVAGAASIMMYFTVFSKPAQLSISVKRFLPERCAVNTPFPVVLLVDITPSCEKTLLVKEDIPHVLKILKTEPTASTATSGLLKWLFRGKVDRKKFTYLALLPIRKKARKSLRFRGKVTIKSDQTISVDTSGDEKIEIAPYHWADRNGDYVIDDEEILDAYDLLSGVSGSQKMLSGIEKFWTAGGYHWDEKKKKFVPGKEKTKGERSHESEE